MAWFLNFFRKPDPYEHGLSSSWVQFPTATNFTTETVGGYDVCYKLVCHYQKVDHKQFKEARMLEAEHESTFLEAVNSSVVLPTLRSSNRFLRLTPESYPLPFLCQVFQDNQSTSIGRHISCSQLDCELNHGELKLRFQHSGCIVTFLSIELLIQPADLIERNYKRMIRIHDITSIKSRPEYMAIEEAMVVAAARAGLELQRLFHDKQTDQVHQGSRFTISTRLARNALEVSWKFDQGVSRREKMRGYRKEGGFPLEPLPLESNGTCVVDSRVDDKTVLSLSTGQDHFFTFVITETSAGKVEIVESLRFSVRVPTSEEFARAESMLVAIEARKKQTSKLSEKTSKALEELMSFIEFEESVSELETQLIERISKKEYSAEQKAEKIERLRAVVESLHLDR